MEYTIDDSQPNRKTISFSGQFTFSDNQKFKLILDMLNDKKLQFLTLDFAQVTFIDSSGLGMLLLLRDECANRQVNFYLSQPQGQVEKIFMISRFDQLFTIQH